MGRPAGAGGGDPVGDVVHFSCPPAADPAVLEQTRPEEIDVEAFALSLLGPSRVDGARPGDTLEVEVVEVRTASAGFTMIVPGLGLLPDDFSAPYLKTWDLRAGGRARLTEGVSVPLGPFLGTMGTQPDGGEPRPLLPPHRGGGNIDNRYLTAGARLWLPVWCEGGRFSCGDGHAAQGDGEVCISAIECGVEATLRFRLHRTTISAPRFAVPAASLPTGPVHATMGIADDVIEGARTATRAMIDWLADDRGLTRRRPSSCSASPAT